METFTEVISILLLYVFMSFTDVVGPEIRAEYGKVFIGIICMYIALHLFILLSENYRKTRYLIKKTVYNCRIKKLIKKHLHKMNLIKSEVEVKNNKYKN